jgi:hypothetical protein
VIPDDLSTILSALIGPPVVPNPDLFDFLILAFELIVERIVDNFYPPMSLLKFIDYDGIIGFPLLP